MQNWKHKPEFLQENKKWVGENNKIKLSNEQKEYRKKLQKFAIENFSGKVIENQIPIKITTKGIKEFINQPHKYYFEKNELVRDLPNVLGKAKYLGKSKYHKDNTDIIYTHILETKVKNEKSWILIRETKSNRIDFYSISDSDNVLKEIIKKI